MTTESNAVQAEQPNELPGWQRFFAHFISILFHPLLLGVMMAAFLIFGGTTQFAAYDLKGKVLRLLTVIINNLILPGLVVLLLRALGFSKSLQMKTQKERIIPYMACIIFFFWTWYVFKNLPGVPSDLVNMTQGMFFAVCFSFLANIQLKISMHAVGAGGLVGMMLLLNPYDYSNIAAPLAISILLAGLICTARLIVSDHSRRDIIYGLIIGLLSQYLAFRIF